MSEREVIGHFLDAAKEALKCRPDKLAINPVHGLHCLNWLLRRLAVQFPPPQESQEVAEPPPKKSQRGRPKKTNFVSVAKTDQEYV
jgi:hypothetical protein